MNSHVRTVYRQEILQAEQHERSGRVSYYLANLALEEAIGQVMRGDEPTERVMAGVDERFVAAAEANEDDHPLLYLRAKLLRAFLRPIVWSGVLNLDGLNNREARTAAGRIGLEEAVDESADTLNEALELHDELRRLPRAQQTDRDRTRVGELVGFINEATPVQLGGRHTTTKLMVLPSRAYDDNFADTKVDGHVYDNRRRRGETTVFPYQVKSVMNDGPSAGGVPVINQRLLGNMPKSSRWPKDDRDFVTARLLVEERLGEGIDQEAHSTLDRITTDVLNHVTNKKTSR